MRENKKNKNVAHHVFDTMPRRVQSKRKPKKGFKSWRFKFKTKVQLRDLRKQKLWLQEANEAIVASGYVAQVKRLPNIPLIDSTFKHTEYSMQGKQLNEQKKSCKIWKFKFKSTILQNSVKLVIKCDIKLTFLCEMVIGSNDWAGGLRWITVMDTWVQCNNLLVLSSASLCRIILLAATSLKTASNRTEVQTWTSELLYPFVQEEEIGRSESRWNE